MLFKWLKDFNGYIHTTFFMVCTVLLCYLILFEYSITQTLLTVTIGTLYTGILMSGYLHRYCSHKSWSMPRFVEIALMAQTTTLMQSPSMGWAATHMDHHAYTDKEGDPHGHVHSVLQNFLVFNRLPKLTKIPRWMLRDKLYGLQTTWYWEIGITLFTICCLLLGWQTMVSLVAISYLVQVGLNLVGHTKNLEPINKPWLNLIWQGELYHANHHWNPRRARFGPLDLTYFLLILPSETLKKLENS